VALGAREREPAAEVKEAVALEMADVLLYLVRLADKLNIDLGAAAMRKIGLNAIKYPVEQFRAARASTTTRMTQEAAREQQ